jgi:hypothetical protein
MGWCSYKRDVCDDMVDKKAKVRVGEEERGEGGKVGRDLG